MPRLRLHHLALFPAAIGAGLGLGLAALAALAPAAPVALLDPVVPSGPGLTPPADPTQTPATAAGTDVQADWPALFGVEPVPEPPPEPVEEPLDEEPPETDLYAEEVFEEEVYEYPIDSLILRGLLSDGEGGGTAVIETPEGQVTVARGDYLPDGARIAEILPDSVEIDVNGDYYLIEFQLAPPRPSVAPLTGTSTRTRSAMRDEGSLDDSEFPRYIGEEEGPGPSDNGFGLSR